jgi:prepilin-type N-terminal cleavage/methylation domain-containing protein
MHPIPGRQRGFTLVEIAIVLVIIGLLLGGVLKGQGLIDSARVKNIIQQSTSLTAAVNAYQDKFRALPGDDVQATSHVPGATGNGNGDGQIAEYQLAPQHLALGGFITGSFNGTTDFMTSAQGGAVYIYNDVVAGRGGNGVRLDNLHYVLRTKPAPADKLLPSAHAIDREFRVMDALHKAGFPVARQYALCPTNP